MESLPVRLETPPLIEAIFEIRFAGTKLFASDLLPGMLYGSLSHAFENAESLPIANLPRELREEDATLRYQPTVRFTGPEGALLLGDHVFSVSKSPPYEGWTQFRERIAEVLAVVRSTGLISGLERYSLKCVNVIPSQHGFATESLNLAVSVDGYDFAQRGFRLRCEIDMPPYITVVDIGANVTIESPGATREGVLVALDTIRSVPTDDFWDAIPTHIDAAHTHLRTLFFGLLKPETLAAFGPIWE